MYDYTYGSWVRNLGGKWPRMGYNAIMTVPDDSGRMIEVEVHVVRWLPAISTVRTADGREVEVATPDQFVEVIMPNSMEVSCANPHCINNNEDCWEKFVFNANDVSIAALRKEEKVT